MGGADLRNGSLDFAGCVHACYRGGRMATRADGRECWFRALGE